MNIKNENWIRCPYYNDYYISDKGRIYGIYKQQLMSYATTYNGYNRVGLVKNGVVKYERVGRLVALAFIGQPPEGKPQLDHIDRNRKNDEVSNLRWVSAKENNRNRINNRAVQQIDKITDEVIATFGTVAEANEMLGRIPGHSGIFSCIKGKTQTSGGYKWKAVELC